jgi:transglutaminase-like putative cysteine protease
MTVQNSASNPIRWWDLPAATLLLAAMVTAAARLTATKWTLHLDITQTLVLLGVLAGLALGYSRFSSRLVLLFAITYGIFMVTAQLGRTIKGDLQWMERLTVLLNRLGIIIYQILHRETVMDSLLFIVLMAILFWTLGVQSAYTMVRHGNAWQALLPTGVALIVIQSFDPLLSRRAWFLAGFLFFGLVLAARLTYLHQENRWRQTRTATPPHLGLEFIRFTLIIVLVIVLLAWTVPAMASALPAARRAWQPVTRVWNETRERFENVFASLRPSVGVVSEFYGSSALLGKGVPLSDAEVFIVTVPQDSPPSLRFYWRARTYETYESGQWLSLINIAHDFQPGENDLPFSEVYGRWPGTFDILAVTQMSTLFAPAQPLWVSRPGLVEYAENPDGTIDLSTFRAEPSLQSGQTYKAQSSISYASIAQLRQAGEEYPDWVLARYLQLPDSISPRTRQLAEQITAGLDNPYDKVMAVTNYLRENIEYVNELPQDPPADQEILDWFLFDLKQGFCNYYASAEVILLRAIGIPARWAVGYAQGERMTTDVQQAGLEEGSFVVRQRDAHAWPEIFFPGIGWVEFEPTTAQPNIIRLNDSSNLTDEELAASQEDEESLRRKYALELAQLREQRGDLSELPSDQNRLNVVYWLVPLILGGALLYLGWRARSRLLLQPAPIMLEAVFKKAGIRPPKIVQLWARRAELPPLAKAYQEVNLALSRLGKPPDPTDTPTERAVNLASELPPTKTHASRLVSEYQIGTFSNQPANLAIALRAAAEIKGMSVRAKMQNLLARLHKPAPSPGLRQRGG